MRSDAEIVADVLAGRRELFAELVKRYDVAVRSSTLAILHDMHAAQDASQDVFVTAYVRLASLKSPDAFGGWLLQIARRHALTALQRKRNLQPLDSIDPPAPPSRNGQLDEDAHALLAAVNRLPEHERTVVMLNYFSGQKVADIARITGRPLSTVTVQLSRARARLRVWLKAVRP